MCVHKHQYPPTWHTRDIREGLYLDWEHPQKIWRGSAPSKCPKMSKSTYNPPPNPCMSCARVCVSVSVCVSVCVWHYIDSCNCCVLAPFGVKICTRVSCWNLLTSAKKICELLSFHRDFWKNMYFTRFCMYFSNVHFSWKNHHFFVCNSFTYDRIQLRFLQQTWNTITLLKYT